MIVTKAEWIGDGLKRYTIQCVCGSIHHTVETAGSMAAIACPLCDRTDKLHRMPRQAASTEVAR